MNAKNELIAKIESMGKSIEDVIALHIDVYSISVTSPSLTTGILGSINIDYDDSSGTRELYGQVLFNDNTWLQRHRDQDGIDSWVHCRMPTVENILLLGEQL